jgi:hypothetical protein
MKKQSSYQHYYYLLLAVKKKEIDPELKEKCVYAKWRSTKAMPKTNYQKGRMFAHDENGGKKC